MSPQTARAELVYNHNTGELRTLGGNPLGTYDSLDDAANAFTGYVINTVGVDHTMPTFTAQPRPLTGPGSLRDGD